MLSVAVVALLAGVVQTHSSSGWDFGQDGMDKTMDTLVDKFFDRRLENSLHRNADLDNATLGKDDLVEIPKHQVSAHGAAETARYASEDPELLNPKKFSEDMISGKILHAEYAVRGVVPTRAGEIAAKLKTSKGSYPFSRLIACNIGNPQAVQQKPITFYREVAAATNDPNLLNSNVYPEDVVRRAKEYLAATGGSGVGAYTDSNGLMLVRNQVAKFIEERDGYPADPNHIQLTTGASEGAKRAISALITNDRCGIMIPRPQYPLYSAALTMTGGRIVYYDQFEDMGWRTTSEELERSYEQATSEGTIVRAITVITPGNPVGAVMSHADVEQVIKFATARKLVILADEVYMTNVYAMGKEFHSFKKVLRQLQGKTGGGKYKDTQLISFHSTSKGVIGECGQRGGYMELVGFSEGVFAQFTKVAATSLSSGTPSQIFVGLMVKPPAKGEPSYDLFQKEYNAIFAGLNRRAKRLTDALNKIPGISCQEIEGAMYAFPSLDLPEKAIEEAEKRGMAADEFWCLELLESTGVVTVPGSGFGQVPGTYHFRTTILPQDDVLEDMIQKVGAFQAGFLKKYGAFPMLKGGEDEALHPRTFTEDMISKKILEAEYAVRGVVPTRAGEINAKLKSGKGTYPFKRLIFCNIGNPQAVQQKPITFYREVASACLDPNLLTANIYPKDVVRRAKEYLAATGGSGVGAYTDSNGLMLVRQQVAAFIEKRDGFPANPNQIQLTTGASEGAKRAIAALITNEKTGMMIPRPQYPLYSAALTMTGGQIVYYDLFEKKGWRTDLEELARAYAEAKAQGIVIRAICVITPGNPVGAVMSRDDIVKMITFATEHKLVIMADEVYMTNVYASGKEFHSYKKVLRQLQRSYPKKFAETQLISFHSTSKGVIGECGQRGGYMELVGFSDEVMGQFTKVAATSLSSGTLSQIYVGLMVKPPVKGDPSYDLFKKEFDGIFDGLYRRAKRLTDALNKIPGISCQEIEGAMYAFPSLDIPDKGVKEAARRGIPADEFWCLELLERTGVVTVPGSGFGQAAGTYHFRTTILPQDDVLEDMIEKVSTFQADFLKKYGDTGGKFILR